jgi:hypothetical protein
MPEKKSKPKHAEGRHPIDRGPAPDEDRMVALAKRVTDACGDPVVGGVAVILHGGGRSTYDIDLYSLDFWETHVKLEAAGILWNADKREHTIEGVAVHMVKDESLGGPPKHISTIRGVKVIGLADLIRGKLTIGLEHAHRYKDLAHVVDLIGRIPLGKDFASKLPKHLRVPYKVLVGQVHQERRTPNLSSRQYSAKFGTPRVRAATKR